jgi:hypothetical protein
VFDVHPAAAVLDHEEPPILCLRRGTPKLLANIILATGPPFDRTALRYQCTSSKPAEKGEIVPNSIRYIGPCQCEY